jgi:hypothetical protein
LSQRQIVAIHVGKRGKRFCFGLLPLEQTLLVIELFHDALPFPLQVFIRLLFLNQGVPDVRRETFKTCEIDEGSKRGDIRFSSRLLTEQRVQH